MSNIYGWGRHVDNSGILASFSIASTLLIFQTGRTGFPHTEIKNVNYMILWLFFPGLIFISLIPYLFVSLQVTNLSTHHPIAFIWEHSVSSKFSIIPWPDPLIMSAFLALWCMDDKGCLQVESGLRYEVDSGESHQTQTSVLKQSR